VVPNERDPAHAGASRREWRCEIFDPNPATTGYDQIEMIGSTLVLLCPAATAPTSMLHAGASGADDARGAALAIAFMGLCTLAFAVTRATAVRRTFVTSRHKVDASLDLLRLVARRQRSRALAFAATCVVAGALIARLPFELEGRMLLEVTPALMLLVALVSAWQLHRLVRIATDRSLHVSTHGPFMYAARAGRLVGWVSAPPALVASASELPVARLHVPHAAK
jgi:hypothetical protein